MLQKVFKMTGDKLTIGRLLLMAFSDTNQLIEGLYILICLYIL